MTGTGVCPRVWRASFSRHPSDPESSPAPSWHAPACQTCRGTPCRGCHSESGWPLLLPITILLAIHVQKREGIIMYYCALSTVQQTSFFHTRLYPTAPMSDLVLFLLPLCVSLEAVDEVLLHVHQPHLLPRQLLLHTCQLHRRHTHTHHTHKAALTWLR